MENELMLLKRRSIFSNSPLLHWRKPPSQYLITLSQNYSITRNHRIIGPRSSHTDPVLPVTHRVTELGADPREQVNLSSEEQKSILR